MLEKITFLFFISYAENAHIGTQQHPKL